MISNSILYLLELTVYNSNIIHYGNITKHYQYKYNKSSFLE